MPNGCAVDQSAASFLVEKVNLYPGEVTVVALGPLTNLALVVYLSSVLFYSLYFAMLNHFKEWQLVRSGSDLTWPILW